MPNMYKYAYSSKTMVYLEQGIPILALIEKKSEEAALNYFEKNIYSLKNPSNKS